MAAVLAAAALVAFLLFGGGGGYEVTARFLNAGQLVKGNVVQIGGAPAGSVDVDQDHAGRPGRREAEDRGSLHAAAGGHARGGQAAARCRASPTASWTSSWATATARRSTTAARIGPDDTDVAVELDQIFNLFDPVARVAVQDFFKGSRKMIEGRGQELNRGTKYLNPSLSTSRRLFGELARDEVLLRDFLTDSSDLVGALAERRSDLTGAVGNLNRTFGALRSEKSALAESVERLPPFMRRANTTFVNLRAALDDVDPLVDASEPVARRLEPFLAEARGFAADAKPTVRDLSATIRRAGAAQRPDRLRQQLPAAGAHRPAGAAHPRRHPPRRLPRDGGGAQRRGAGDRLRAPVHAGLRGLDG